MARTDGGCETGAMESDELREEWNKAERDLADATHPPDVEELTKRAEERYEEYMRAKEADAILRRAGASDQKGV
jgi:hypothetical protein